MVAVPLETPAGAQAKADAAVESALAQAAGRVKLNALDLGVERGVGDQAAEIAAALDLVPDGAAVYFPEGEYWVNSSRVLLSQRSNVLIVGDYGKTIFKTDEDHDVFRVNECVDLTFDGIGVQGDGDVDKTNQRGIQIFDACENIRVLRCHVTDLGYDGIVALWGVTGLTIAECYVAGCKDDGINPGGGGGSGGVLHVAVVANRIENCTNDGIHISDGSSHVTATGNVVSGCKSGIGFYGATNAVVSSNSIHGSTGRAIEYYSTASARTVVTGNVIRGGTAGLYMPEGTNSRAIVANNMFQMDGSGRGIEMRGTGLLNIIGNIVVSASDYAILLSRNSSPGLHARILDNIVDSGVSQQAIRVVNYNPILVRGNSIYNITGSVGIYLEDTIGYVDGNLLPGKTITNTGDSTATLGDNLTA